MYAGVEPQRGLEGAQRFLVLPLVVVDDAEHVVDVGERLVLLDHLGEVLLGQRVLALQVVPATQLEGLLQRVGHVRLPRGVTVAPVPGRERAAEPEPERPLEARARSAGWARDGRRCGRRAGTSGTHRRTASARPRGPGSVLGPRRRSRLPGRRTQVVVLAHLGAVALHADLPGADVHAPVRAAELLRQPRQERRLAARPGVGVRRHAPGGLDVPGGGRVRPAEEGRQHAPEPRELLAVPAPERDGAGGHVERLATDVAQVGPLGRARPPCPAPPPPPPPGPCPRSTDTLTSSKRTGWSSSRATGQESVHVGQRRPVLVREGLLDLGLRPGGGDGEVQREQRCPVPPDQERRRRHQRDGDQVGSPSRPARARRSARARSEKGPARGASAR